MAALTRYEIFATNAQKAIISNADTLREITATVTRQYNTIAEQNEAFYRSVAIIAVKHAEALTVECCRSGGFIAQKPIKSTTAEHSTNVH